jgi:peptide/nickel transport system permease protein
MRFVDAKMAIPGLLLSMLFLLVLGGGIFTVRLALGFNWSSAQTRLIRSQALSVKGREYYDAAKAMGVSNFRLIMIHMMPNSIQPIIVQASLGVGFAILGDTSLSFLGLGLRPPAVSYGVLLKDAQNVQSVANMPWLFIPAILVIVVILALNFMGDGIRDAADPYQGV